jgi:hypothetical protein
LPVEGLHCHTVVHFAGGLKERERDDAASVCPLRIRNIGKSHGGTCEKFIFTLTGTNKLKKKN